MMKIKLIALGKLKESYLKEAAAEYVKRLSRYCDLEIIELNPVRLPDSPSEAEIAAALDTEAGMILKKLPQGCRLYALCVEGRQCDSEGFADEIKSLSAAGETLCFVIGSSYGLAGSIKNKADKRMSVSQMTFPHQLFRIMLLEQLYRAFKINEGGTYHK